MAGQIGVGRVIASVVVAVALASAPVMTGGASAQIINPPGNGSDGLPQWEGQWSSFMRNVHQGFNSRTWPNNIATTTRIEFVGCSVGSFDYQAFSSTDVQLTRRTGLFWPDQNKGRKRLHCRQFDAQNWTLDPAGDPGDYRFAITHINGCASCVLGLNVDVVTVKYGRLR